MPWSTSRPIYILLSAFLPERRLLRRIADFVWLVFLWLGVRQRDWMRRLTKVMTAASMVFRPGARNAHGLFRWLIDCLLLALCYGSLNRTRGFFGGCFFL